MKRYTYDRISGPELRQRLEELGWPDGEMFAFVYGTDPRRVAKWMHGEEDIPVAVNLVLRLLELPGAKTLAVDVTRATSRPTERDLEYRRRSAEKARGNE